MYVELVVLTVLASLVGRYTPICCGVRHCGVVDDQLSSGVTQLDVYVPVRVDHLAVAQPDHLRGRNASHWAVEYLVLVDDRYHFHDEVSSIQ